MKRKTTLPRKAPAKLHTPPPVESSAPFLSLRKEGRKKITLDQLGLTEDEMHILVGGACQIFPPDEETFS